MRARRTGGRILEYFCTDDRLFMWVIDAGGSLHAASAAISRQELVEQIAAIRRAMAADDFVDSRPLLRRVHHTLIEPIASHLPRDRDRLLTIVPHGPLFLISFAALQAFRFFSAYWRICGSRLCLLTEWRRVR